MCSRQAALLPWRTIEDNIALPLGSHGARQGQRESRIKSKIWNWSTCPVSRRSSPGSCRAACSSAPPSPARSPSKPDMLLMDEPFGALDEIVRDHLNEQLLKLWAKTKKTVVFVTHSIPEAVFLSTKIVVMSPRPGRIYEIIDCDLWAAERSLDVRETPEFLKIAHRVREG
jgi:NitT/TauT family transport system ATP-binding protein